MTKRRKNSVLIQKPGIDAFAISYHILIQENPYNATVLLDLLTSR